MGIYVKRYESERVYFRSIFYLRGYILSERVYIRGDLLY